METWSNGNYHIAATQFVVSAIGSNKIYNLILVEGIRFKRSKDKLAIYWSRAGEDENVAARFVDTWSEFSST